MIKLYFHCCVLLLFSYGSFAQSESDTLSRFYSINDQLEFKKIEREHIPLNGDSVSLIPFRVNDQFGFVNKVSGQWVVQPKYEQVFAVYPEGAIVKNSNGYGMIDNKGNIMIPCQFENLLKENDLYCGSIFGIVDTSIKNEMYNSYILTIYYDRYGKGLFVENSHDNRTFQGNDTLAWFRYGTTYKIRNKNGQLLFTFKFNLTNRFIDICDNLLIYAFIKSKDDILYKGIDINGKGKFSLQLNEEGIDGIYQLSDDLFGYYFDDGDFFFTNKKGEKKQYGVISESVGFYKHNGNFFQNQLFVVKDFQTEKFGIINRKGDIILPFKCKNLVQLGEDTFLYEGRTLINSAEKILFQIPSPSLTVDFKYQTNQSLNIENARYLVKDNVRFKHTDSNKVAYETVHGDQFHFYYVNQDGKNVLELAKTYEFATDFHEGLAAVADSNGKLGFVDTTGKLIIPLKYELSMAGSYPIPYLVVPEFKGGFAYIKSFKGYIDKKGKEYFSGKRVQDHYNFSH